jgi:hypothetical protein
VCPKEVGACIYARKCPAPPVPAPPVAPR